MARSETRYITFLVTLKEYNVLNSFSWHIINQLEADSVYLGVMYYYCGIFGYCSKHLTNIFWGWTIPLSHHYYIFHWYSITTSRLLTGIKTPIFTILLKVMVVKRWKYDRVKGVYKVCTKHCIRNTFCI